MDRAGERWRPTGDGLQDLRGNLGVRREGERVGHRADIYDHELGE